TDASLAQWRRESRPCGDDLEAEVKAEVKLLEAAFPAARLKFLAATGGVADEESLGGRARRRPFRATHDPAPRPKFLPATGGVPDEASWAGRSRCRPSRPREGLATCDPDHRLLSQP